MKGDKLAKDRARKRSEWLARNAASKVVLFSCYGIDEGRVSPFTLAGKRAALRMVEAKALEKTPIKWRIHNIVIMRDSTGRDYWKSEEVRLPAPALQSAIHKGLSHYHFDFMQEQNIKHVLGLAWVATAADEVDPAVIEKLIIESGAWQRLNPVIVQGDGTFHMNPKKGPEHG